MKISIQVLVVFIFICNGIISSTSAKEVNAEEYEKLKQQAIDFEDSLPPQINSKLSQSYGPVLIEVFKQCVPIARPTTFEVVSLVNKEGAVEESWTMTPSEFGQCAKKVFYGQTLYSIGDKPFYAILNFNLTQ